MGWKVIDGGEYPIIEFDPERCTGIQCDRCGRIVPIRYTESFFGNLDGHHDGRDGKYFVCRDVYGLAGTGMLHKRCG